MHALICRFLLLFLLVLPGSYGNRGMVVQACSESQPSHESGTGEAASALEAITGGARDALRRHRHPATNSPWSADLSPQWGCKLHRIAPVSTWPGHRFPNGLNAPLLA